MPGPIHEKDLMKSLENLFLNAEGDTAAELKRLIKRAAAASDDNTAKTDFYTTQDQDSFKATIWGLTLSATGSGSFDLNGASTSYFIPDKVIIYMPYASSMAKDAAFRIGTSAATNCILSAVILASTGQSQFLTASTFCNAITADKDIYLTVTKADTAATNTGANFTLIGHFETISEPS